MWGSGAEDAEDCCPRSQPVPLQRNRKGHVIRGGFDRGCGLIECGFCGPRLAEDWARAIAAREPDTLVTLHPPVAERGVLRKRINRFLSELRSKLGDPAESVWWVERETSTSVQEVRIRLVRRGSRLGEMPAAFTELARARGLAATRPEAERAYQYAPVAWSNNVLLRSILPLPRAGLDASTYGAAKAYMSLHRSMNGRDIAHRTDGYFVDAGGRRLPVARLLRATSTRRYQGFFARCAPAPDRPSDAVNWRDGEWLLDSWGPPEPGKEPIDEHLVHLTGELPYMRLMDADGVIPYSAGEVGAEEDQEAEGP